MTLASRREIHTAATLRRGNSCIAVYGTPEEAGESCMQATQGGIISAQAVLMKGYGSRAS